MILTGATHGPTPRHTAKATSLDSTAATKKESRTKTWATAAPKTEIEPDVRGPLSAMSTTLPTTTTGANPGCIPMDMGLVGINPTDGTAETAGMTTGTTLGATEEETTGTIHGAGTVLGATADIMVTAVTVDIMAMVATAALIFGTTKVGAETSLAAEAIPNPPLTTDYGACKSNRE